MNNETNSTPEVIADVSGLYAKADEHAEDSMHRTLDAALSKKSGLTEAQIAELARGFTDGWPTVKQHVADGLPIAVARHIAPVVARMIAEAEQRGREDNADHGLCYVSGSKALDGVRAEAWGEGFDAGWMRGRRSNPYREPRP